MNTPDASLYVRQLPVGPMKNFVYFVGDASSTEVVVIDPAWDVAAILRAAEADGKRITAAALTHHHHDHINGVPGLLGVLDVPIYVQKTELDFAEPLKRLGSAVRTVKPGETLEVGALSLTCVHTPGHTPGSQCVLARSALVSGDTVFVNACGRCDLPGGDVEAMHDSLFNVLGRLPGDTTLWPGHDYGDVTQSTLARERANNPYFQLRDLQQFVAKRMAPRR